MIAPAVVWKRTRCNHLNSFFLPVPFFGKTRLKYFGTLICSYLGELVEIDIKPLSRLVVKILYPTMGVFLAVQI